MPSISVVTITYNDPIGLKKTLHSLRDLDLDWEHIVVDSSPGINAPLLSALPNGWPLLHKMTEPNGIFAAMNEGMRCASKDFVVFLNGGDQLKSCAALLNVMAALGGRPSADILVAGVDLEREGAYQYTRVPAATPLRNLIGCNRICHQAVVYRRSSLATVGEFDHGRYKHAADYDHLYRYYISGSRWVISREVLVIYDMGGNSSVHYAPVLSEFRKIQAAYAHRLSTRARWANALLSRVNERRVHGLKAVASSFAGQRLRPIWNAWNRYKATPLVAKGECHDSHR